MMYPVGLLVFWTVSTFVTGSEYLIAVHTRSTVDFNDNGSGGSARVVHMNYNRTRTYSQNDPYFSHSHVETRIEEQIGTTLGYDDSAALISCSNSAMNLTVYSDNYRYNVFSPLSVNALGSRYVVSSCIQSDFEFSVLVVTAYKLKADVAIIFDTNVKFAYDGQIYGKGDTFRLRLKAYQTFTFRVRDDLSGTRIDSTETIAVFSGTANTTTVYTYTQLMPVDLFSDEYVLAVDDSTPPFQLQVVSDQDNFEMTFNNGTIISTNIRIMNRLLKQNETFYFASSQPVMVTLCRSVGNQKGFALLLPTSLYADFNNVEIRGTTIIVAHNTADIDISHPFITGEVKNISNTSFKLWIYSTIPTFNSGITYNRKFSGMLITFRPETFYSSGLPLAKKDQTITESTSERSQSHQETTVQDTVLATESTSERSQSHQETTVQDTVLATGNNVTLIVGCVSGFIILVLGCIIIFLFIRLKRKTKSKSVSETQNSGTGPAERETSFEVDPNASETHPRAGDSNMGGEGHTYSDLAFEGQAVNLYERLDGKHDNEDTQLEGSNRTNTPHGNTYSNINCEGQDVNEYEKIDDYRKTSNSDCVNY